MVERRGADRVRRRKVAVGTHHGKARRQLRRVGLPYAAREKSKLGRRIAREIRMPAEAERKCGVADIFDVELDAQRVGGKREALTRAIRERPLPRALAARIVKQLQRRVRGALVVYAPRALPAVAVYGVRLAGQIAPERIGL